MREGVGRGITRNHGRSQDFLLGGATYWQVRGTEEECSTEACKDAASRLRFYMDTSVDPCENFYDFACGAFHEKTTIPEGTLAAGALIDMMLKSHETLYEVLGAEGTSDEPTAFKSVRNYYRTCKENKNNLEDLKSLLNKTGVFPVVLGDSWEEQNFKWDEAVKQLAKEGIPINTAQQDWSFPSCLRR